MMNENKRQFLSSIESALILEERNEKRWQNEAH